MSRENVEVVRRIFDAVARRDTETVLALYAPEVEWDNSGSPLGEAGLGGVYHGHDGLRAFFREWYEAWREWEEQVEELIDAGDHVVAIATGRARGRASGIEADFPRAGVWTIRDGRVVRVVMYSERTDALEAVGLSE